MSASRFVDFRNDNDPLQTVEGDNNVLLQQTSNHLLSIYEKFLSTKKVPNTPLEQIHLTGEFLSNYDKLANKKFTVQTKEELLRPDGKNRKIRIVFFYWH